MTSSSSPQSKLSPCMYAKLLQSCPALCDPMDCSLPGSSVHGILQARILEWVALPSSRGSSQPRDLTCVSCLLHWQAGPLPLTPPGKPKLSPSPLNLTSNQCYFYHPRSGYAHLLYCLNHMQLLPGLPASSFASCPINLMSNQHPSQSKSHN